jgi:hypothetical protein
LLEAAPAGDVVDEDCAGGAAVVGARDAAEALCAGSVPELQLYALAVRGGGGFAVGDVDYFGGEFDADCLRGEDAPWGVLDWVIGGGPWGWFTFVLYEAV